MKPSQFLSSSRRRPPNAPPVPCSRCSRPTSEPRRGLCIACYLDDHHGRAPLVCCESCSKSDPAVLLRRSMVGDVRTLCGDCATRLGRRRLTLAELQHEVRPPGDRRLADRRYGDRRAAGQGRRQELRLEVPDDRRGSSPGRRAGEAC